MQKLQKGMIMIVDDSEVVVTKISKCDNYGILDGSSQVGEAKVTPVYRLCYERPDKTQGHIDAATNLNVVTDTGMTRHHRQTKRKGGLK